MDGVPATYLGRIVSKENFRTFIYAKGGAKRLVESWDDFEDAMASGAWFATLEESNGEEEVATPTPKKAKKPPVKAATAVELLEEDEAPLAEDEGTFEVKDDDFLPKASK